MFISWLWAQLFEIVAVCKFVSAFSKTEASAWWVIVSIYRKHWAAAAPPSRFQIIAKCFHHHHLHDTNRAAVDEKKSHKHLCIHGDYAIHHLLGVWWAAEGCKMTNTQHNYYDLVRLFLGKYIISRLHSFHVQWLFQKPSDFQSQVRISKAHIDCQLETPPFVYSEPCALYQ